MSIKEEIILHTINLGNPALLADLLAYVQHLQNIDQAQLSQVPVRKFNMLTAAQIKSPSYVYKPIKREHVVGVWPGNESVEEILSLRTK